MVTRQSLQHRLTAIESQEPDRTWFEQRPARTHRMRLPTFDDLRDYGTKTTHVIVARRGVKQLSRAPITLPASADPFYVGLLLKDTPKDGVQDLAISLALNASRKNRRDDLAKIITRASQLYR